MTNTAEEIYSPITIVGGGLVGLALAIALAQAGQAVTVLDKTPPQTQQLPEFDGRVCAISLGSQRLLENIGVWQHLQPFAEPILDILVQDNHSPVFVHYTSNAQTTAQGAAHSVGFGATTPTKEAHYEHTAIGNEPMGHILENRHTRQALEKRAAELPLLSYLAPAEWEVLENDAEQATLLLKDGRKILSQLIIAADSKFSALRKAADIETLELDYHQTAIVATIQHEKPHQGLAKESFFAEGPFAILPMQGSHSSLVWVETPQKAKLYLKLSTEQQEAEIAKRIGGYLGKATLKDKPSSFPMMLILAKQLYQGRVAVVGDAAHGIHPIAGQGLNLGYRDVAAFAEVLIQAAKLGQDFGSPAVLKQYQQWRRFDTLTMAGVTDGITRLFSNHSKALKLARNIGLAVVEHIPPAKHFFMQHAMGTVGDLPPLMHKKSA